MAILKKIISAKPELNALTGMATDDIDMGNRLISYQMKISSLIEKLVASCCCREEAGKTVSNIIAQFSISDQPEITR